MSFFRRTHSPKSAPSTEPPGNLSSEDWESLKAGTLVSITDFHDFSRSVERLAQELEKNTTLVECNTDLHGANCDMALSAAIVKSRNPNMLYSGMNVVGANAESVVLTTAPVEIDRLYVLMRHNREAAVALLDKMIADPAALTDEERLQINLRAPAIKEMAKRERALDERAIIDLFEKANLPSTAQKKENAPPFDAKLEAALAQHQQPEQFSKLKLLASIPLQVGLGVKGLLAARKLENELRQRDRSRSTENQQKERF